MVHSILPIIPGMIVEPWFVVIRHLVLYPFMRAKKNIVNHVRQSGYFMTSWHGIYGMDPAIRAHQKVNVDSLFSLFVLINTFVCWPYYGCCYDVFLWDKEVIYQKQQAPFTLQYLTTGWTLQLVEHTHPFSSEKSELHQVASETHDPCPTAALPSTTSFNRGLGAIPRLPLLQVTKLWTPTKESFIMALIGG